MYACGHTTFGQRPTVLTGVQAALLATVSPLRPLGEPEPGRSLYQLLALGTDC